MTKSFDEKNMAKSRAVCEAMAEAASTGKRVLTEREKRILDIWPRFEDGEPLWFGDKVDEFCGEVSGIYFDGYEVGIYSYESDHLQLNIGERVKRPVQSVLDADGVEIHVGDTVWHEDGSEQLVEEMNRYGVRCFDGDKRRTFNPKYLTHTRPAPKVLDADRVEIHVGDTIWYRSLCTMGSMRKATVTGFGEHSLDGPLATLKDEAGRTWHIDPKKITHVQPDSWEQLEEDASKDTCVYFGGTGHFDCSECSSGGINCFRRMKLDIVRRAKVLAGVEVDE